MKVFPVVPRGYCKGVVAAILIAQKTREQYPNENIYILGMIVHNEHVVKLLKQQNIETVDQDGMSRSQLLDTIDHGIVILTAHGTSKVVIEKAKAKGLTIVDGTCKDVTRTHQLVEDYLKQGYDIIYIGKANHPEAQATLSINPKQIHLVEKATDIAKLKIENEKILLTNQTTMSFLDIEDLYQQCKKKFKSLELSKEICHATQVRQEAILKLPEDIDLVLVVGDKRSNNSNRLCQLAKQRNIESYLIEDIEQLEIKWLLNSKHVAVTAGASTPTYLVNTILNYLNDFDANNEETHNIKASHFEPERL